MREMTVNERQIIETEVRMLLQNSVSSEYVRYILEDREKDEEEYGCVGNTFMEDVIEDVRTSSAWDDEGYYNEDDIRLAIGRTVMARLGIEV